MNGLQTNYEAHGSGGTPLLLLHGGLFNIDLQFGELRSGWASFLRQTRPGGPPQAVVFDCAP